MIDHEYLSMDERENAAQCFRLAVHAPRRPLPLLLERIEYKKENYQGHHDELSCAVGNGAARVVAGKRVVADTALCYKQFPWQSNPSCRLQNVSLLYSMDHMEKTQRALEVLGDLAPKESLVYLLMGKVILCWLIDWVQCYFIASRFNVLMYSQRWFFKILGEQGI